MLPDTKVHEFSEGSETRGNLKFQNVEKKLLHSVVEHDEKEVSKGKLMSQAINQGFSSFHPDLMMEHLTKDYAQASRLYGEGLMRLVSGYEPSAIKRNINIPEFRRELKQKIEEKFLELRQEGYLNKDGEILDKGYEMAALVMYIEELDHLIPEGMGGQKLHKERSHYGDKTDVKSFKKGDRYRDIALKKSVKKALRRGHTELSGDDLQVFERESRGSVYVVYGMDASGSMKGKKLEMAKKAGIALSFRAVEEKDHVGLLVFGREVREEIAPTQEFSQLLKTITRVQANQETNLVRMLEEAVRLFPKGDFTKHLVILSDALPTIGKDPEKETLQAVGVARGSGITVSVVGLNLDERGKELAEKIVQLGEGRLYDVKQLENMDTLILEDYYSVR
tara:strand:+ start:3068 stop:4246 length:1179 start_codon:yes stop_codon:yes gene_type:complete